MQHKLKPLLAALILLAFGCNQNTSQDITIGINPEAGTSYKTGDKVSVKISYPADVKPDSIVYLLDSVKAGSREDSTALILTTDSMRLGPRLIIAKFYRGGVSQDVTTNIVLLPVKAPDEYTYKVIKVFPHDTSSYTEGLLYADGVLYESTGNEGHSTVRKSDLNTGKALQVTKLDSKYFGEGISIVDDKLIQMTYREKIGFVYDKNTLKQLSTFTNNVGIEGWGMCFDGNKLYLDDKTNRIYFLDKNTYHQTGYVDVYDNKGPIDSVNELEYIDKKLYSNIYTKDTILVINPKTGAVLQRVDMKNLWPLADRPKDYNNHENVLNGIAWDEKGKRLFVTGKKWPHLYQVEFVKK
jgi:glutaminyl-peptide cyclotransferase